MVHHAFSKRNTEMGRPWSIVVLWNIHRHISLSLRSQMYINVKSSITGGTLLAWPYIINKEWTFASPTRMCERGNYRCHNLRFMTVTTITSQHDVAYDMPMYRQMQYTNIYIYSYIYIYIYMYIKSIHYWDTITFGVQYMIFTEAFRHRYLYRILLLTCLQFST